MMHEIIERDTAERHRQLIKIAGRGGGQVLIIVPEKWLLQKILSAVPALARTRVVTVQASMPVKQWQSIWNDVASGKLKIIIGTQKAFFLPYRNLKTIIIDEAQFPTHKLWDQYPRLHNINAARALAGIHHAELVYSGSFPLIQSEDGFAQHPVQPKISVISASYEDQRRRWLLPQQFITELRGWIRKRQQIVILRNRQGETGAAKIKIILKQLFPRLHQARQIIVDTAALFTHIQDSQVDRVVWLFPEDTLLYPDFRSAERAWCTLARLQRLLPARGRIVVVTRGQHATRVERILGAAPANFFEKELAERKRLGYPPFNDMVRLTVTGKTAALALAAAIKLRQAIDGRLRSNEAIKVQGPFSSFERNTKNQRHLLLLGPLPRLTELYQGLPVTRVDVSPERIL